MSNRLRAQVSGQTGSVLGCTVPLLPGSVTSGTGTALVRPEFVRLRPDPAGPATVLSVSFLGSISRVHCRLDDGQELTAQVSSAEGAALSPQDRVAPAVDAEPVLVVAA